MKATFIYLNSRRGLIDGVRRGEEPDSSLYGALQLPEHGIDVGFHDPLLTRRDLPAPLARVAWNLRELSAPFELGRTDVVFTPLAALLPLSARVRRLPVVAMNFGLNLIWRRASPARRALLGASLRSAARIVCLGESQRIELVESADLDPERVVTMHVPIDAEFFRPQGEADDRAVLAVGKDLARDYVDDGVEALVVPPGDETALRSAVERVLGDRELARSLGAAARARVERSCASPVFAAELAPLLRSVI